MIYECPKWHKHRIKIRNSEEDRVKIILDALQDDVPFEAFIDYWFDTYRELFHRSRRKGDWHPWQGCDRLMVEWAIILACQHTGRHPRYILPTSHAFANMLNNLVNKRRGDHVTYRQGDPYNGTPGNVYWIEYPHCYRIREIWRKLTITERPRTIQGDRLFFNQIDREGLKVKAELKAFLKDGKGETIRITREDVDGLKTLTLDVQSLRNIIAKYDALSSDIRNASS
jgi:hypothetical protein